MKLQSCISLILCVSLPCVTLAAENNSFQNITYDGGSLPNVKPGNDLRLYINSTNVRFVKNKSDITVVPSSAITEISYGQDVHRRVGAAIGLAMVSFGLGAIMLFTKSKKHYVGITWDDNGQKGGAAFQCDKNEYRGVISGLEGVSGKKAIDSAAMNVKN